MRNDTTLDVEKYDTSGQFVSTVISDTSTLNDLEVTDDGLIYMVSGTEIRKYDLQGNPLATYDPSQASSCKGIAVDKAGNVYLSDVTQSKIHKFDATMNYITSWGGLQNPRGISVDDHGRVVVVEYDNDHVSMYDMGGNYIATMGSSGTGQGKFISPYGLAIGSSGKLFVADIGGMNVEVFAHPEKQ